MALPRRGAAQDNNEEDNFDFEFFSVISFFLQYSRLPARNDDEEDDAEEDGGDGGDPDQAAHRLLELLEREGDHEGEDDRQLSEHKAIDLE